MRISDWSSDVCSSDLRIFPGFGIGNSGFENNPNASPEPALTNPQSRIPNPMLKIDNIHATAAGREILQGLTLAMNPGPEPATMRHHGAVKPTTAHSPPDRHAHPPHHCNARHDHDPPQI